MRRVYIPELADGHLLSSEGEIMQTANCDSCGKKISWDVGFLSGGTPASAGIFGYLCSDCERERNETERHAEGTRQGERAQRAAEQQHGEFLRLQEEQHRERLRADEQSRQEERWLQEEAEERALDKAHAQRAEVGFAAFSSAKDLHAASMWDEALKAALRAQESLGARPDLENLKLEIAIASRKDAFARSILSGVESRVLGTTRIANAEEHRILVAWMDIIRSRLPDHATAKALGDHVANLWEQTLQREAAVLEEKRKREEVEAERKSHDERDRSAVRMTFWVVFVLGMVAMLLTGNMLNIILGIPLFGFIAFCVSSVVEFVIALTAPKSS